MWLVILSCASLGYLLYKLLQLCRADCDLVVLASKMNQSYFEGRVAWVTGSSSGIGEEMCRQLSKMGAKVILTSRNEEKLEEVRKSLAHPENARILPVDLSDPEMTRAATEKARKLFGKIDILVNNAGISTRSLFVDFQEHVHRKVMEVDFFAPWILTHDTIPGMMEEGFGHIINISSVCGIAGMSCRSSYSSAKFAIIGLMDSIRNERCVEVTLIGVSNKQQEVWVSPQPYLMIPYLSHYCPTLLNYYLAKWGRAAVEAMKKKAE